MQSHLPTWLGVLKGGFAHFYQRQGNTARSDVVTLSLLAIKTSVRFYCFLLIIRICYSLTIGGYLFFYQMLVLFLGLVTT